MFEVAEGTFSRYNSVLITATSISPEEFKTDEYWYFVYLATKENGVITRTSDFIRCKGVANIDLTAIPSNIRQSATMLMIIPFNLTDDGEIIFDLSKTRLKK